MKNKSYVKLSVIVVSAILLSSCNERNDNKEGFIPTVIPGGGDAESTVYITPKGYKYHESWCSIVQLRKVRAVTLEEAVEMGRTPCRKCH